MNKLRPRVRVRAIVTARGTVWESVRYEYVERVVGHVNVASDRDPVLSCASVRFPTCPVDLKVPLELLEYVS